MSTKKIDVQLDLKKKSCPEAFDVKNGSGGVFIEGFGNKSTVDRGDEILQGNGKEPVWELDNFKRNPIILFNHGMDTLGGTPIGKAVEIRETPEGLYLKVKLSNSQAPGIKMVRDLVEERILKAFSVGFNPKQVDTMDMDGKSIRKISKAELFEVSVVAVPMNQDSLFELSEKSLTTKSLHQLKTEILKTKKNADVAVAIEAQLALCASRKDAIATVAKTQKLELNHLLDMLAGDREIPASVAAAFAHAIKAADLKQTLEEALSSLGDGATEADVAKELMAKLAPPKEEEPKPDEEKPAEEADPAATDGEEEETEIEKEVAATDGEGEGEEDPGAEEDAKRKADFQDCVNAKVPGLLEDGMEQDAAVAAAIAKCQEEGKCQLTPAGKAAVFGAVFAALEKGGLGKAKIAEVAVFVKAVDDAAQTEQPPTTAISTEKGDEDFGSPYLEGQKQTNVLLGALISEIQKLSNKLDGLSPSKTVDSEEPPAKGQANSSDTATTESEEHAQKRLESLNQRLKNLGV